MITLTVQVKGMIFFFCIIDLVLLTIAHHCGWRKGSVNQLDSLTSVIVLPQPAILPPRLTLEHMACISFCRLSLLSSLSHPCKTSQIFRPISSSCPRLYKTSGQTMPSSAAPHVKARSPEYPGSKVKRFPVPDDKVDWSRRWPQYRPVSYTAPSVLNKPAWADPDIG